MKATFACGILVLLFLFGGITHGTCQQHSSYIQEKDTVTFDVKIAWTKGWRPYYECIVLSKEAPRIYQANEIESYRTNWGNPFVSYQVDSDEWVFLELLETGELELYKYIDKDFKHHYYVKRMDEDTFVEINDRRRRSTRQLKDLWTGCDKFKNLIDKVNINDNALKRLIRAHNKCEYVHIPKIKKSIFFGLNSMGLKFSPSRGYDTAIPGGVLARIIKKKREISFMFELNLSFPITDSDVSFHTGLAINKWTFSDFSFAGLGDVTYISDIDLIDLRIPIGLQYMWPKEKLRPYIIGTFAPHYMIRDNSTLTSEVFTPNNGTIVFTSEQDVSTWGYSGELAVGLAFHINEDQLVHIKFGTLTRFNFQKPRVFNVNSFYLAGGFSF